MDLISPQKRIMDQVVKLGNEEFQDLLERIRQEARVRAETAAIRASAYFEPGDEVVNLRQGRKPPLGARGRVEEVTPGRVVVHFCGVGTYEMPATLVRKVDPASAVTTPPGAASTAAASAPPPGSSGESTVAPGRP